MIPGRPSRVASLVTAGLTAADIWIQGVRAIARSNGSDATRYAAAGEALLRGDFLRDPWINTWPPFFSVWVIPYAWLWEWQMPRARLAVIFAVNVAVMMALVGLSVRALARERPPLWVYCATWLCAMPYLNENLYLHQLNAQVALLAAIAFHRLARNRDDEWAGVFLGLGASIKVQPVLLLPYLLRRPRALSVALVTGVLCAVVPGLWQGASTLMKAWRFWFERGLQQYRGAGVSIPAIGHALLRDSTSSPLVTVAGTFVALALLAWGYSAIHADHRRGTRWPPLLDLAVLLPLAVLVGTVAWRHHLVVLVPAMTALILYLTDGTAELRRRQRVGALAGLAVLLGYAPLLGEIGAAWSLTTLAVLMLIGALMLARHDASTRAWADSRGHFN